MVDATYVKVITNTFQEHPLRTVLMIDDEFPTYGDIFDLAEKRRKANEKPYTQSKLAVALCRGFQSRHMICDVENDVSDIKAERIRKSDLVLLDYHLGPEDGDSSKSIRLLRNLAKSKHFNTIVVYTAEPDLDEVWLTVIASMSGGWADLPSSLTDASKDAWESLSDGEEIPQAAKPAMMRFAMRRCFEDVQNVDLEQAKAELTELRVPEDAQEDILQAIWHRSLASYAGDYADEPHREAVGGFENNVRWVQSDKSFVVILPKADLNSIPQEVEGSEDPGGVVEKVFEGLNAALVAWHPNLFQILVSEIQNQLELDALATGNGLLQDAHTQAALWYYLLQSLDKVDPTAAPDVSVPLLGVIDKLVEGIRRKLTNEGPLLELARDTLLAQLRDAGWTKDNWPDANTKMFDEALKLAGVEGQTDMTSAMFRLNYFFSTEEFGSAHITTGTVFRSKVSGNYWLVASPACDMVARSPADFQTWAKGIYPITSFVAIRLDPYENVDKALKGATTSQFLFFEQKSEKKVFKLYDDNGIPSYELMFALDEGRVRKSESTLEFDVSRFMVETESPEGKVSKETFEVVAQLRGLNSTRALQLVGQHLSRIGLDFVRMPRVAQGGGK